MRLTVTLSTVVDDRVTKVASCTLTPPPEGGSHTVRFGRGTGVSSGRRGDHLGVPEQDDAWVSRDQGAVIWQGSDVWILNHSTRRALAVRPWGGGVRTLASGRHEEERLLDGRAVVEVVDTRTRLTVGPADPYERGWSGSVADVVRAESNLQDHSDVTPDLLSEVRRRIRSQLLCQCRITRAPQDECEASSHDAMERRLSVLIGSDPMAGMWPRQLHDQAWQRQQIAARLGISSSLRKRDMDKIAGLMPEGPGAAENPLQWLVANRVLVFDDVADLAAANA